MDGAGSAGEAAVLGGGRLFDRHVVGPAIGHLGREGEGAVGGDDQVVGAVVLQRQGAHQPQDASPDRAEPGLGGTGDAHAGHVGAFDRARASGDGAVLASGGLLDRHVVGAAVGHLGREGKGAVRRQHQVVGAVVLQRQRSAQAGDAAPDRVKLGLPATGSQEQDQYQKEECG